MRPLKHGYTNRTLTNDATVEKTYDGPDAELRLHRERTLLPYALGHFFRSYGDEVPPWPLRRTAMLARCEELRRFCERWEPGGRGARQWRERAAATAGWEE
ncbi:hypothetical protein ACOKM3_40590 [Streptomyces sp. BH106]|uniref:hypothetical protein n=1 Tax=Streptomyces sp. BH106 TaxID=3410409 RepID=UPI003CF5BD7E